MALNIAKTAKFNELFVILTIGRNLAPVKFEKLVKLFEQELMMKEKSGEFGGKCRDGSPA